MERSSLVSRYFDVVRELGLYSSSDRLRVYVAHVFQDADLNGVAMLDIGCGVGLVSIYAACAGARKVVSLEPEAAGSTAGVTSKYQKLADSLNLENATLHGVTFQEFDPGDEKFDVILLDDSVNHLDEEACINLQHDQAAIESYAEIFRKIHALAADGAKLIITDASRYNFFAMLGLRNPLAPTIDWSVHQSPTYWVKLLSDAGFSRPIIRWRSFNRLGRIGSLLLGNKAAAFFLRSRFCLTMEKKAD